MSIGPREATADGAPPARGNGKAGKSAATRQRILDVAAATFLRKGYTATTLNDIAKASRLRAGSLYYHFDGKEQLLDAVLELGVERLFRAVRAAVEAVPAEAPSLARIETAIGAHLAMLIEGGAYTSCTMRIFGQMPLAVQRRHMPLREAYGEYWRDLFADAAAAGDLRPDIDLSLARMFVFGALNWTPEWFKRGRGGADAAARQLSRLFLAGLASASASPTAPVASASRPPPAGRRPG